MSPSQKKLAAIVAGVLLAGVPVLGFNVWLQGFVVRQAQEEVNLSVRRTMALAESRLTYVLTALDALADRGGGSCRPSNLEAMREAAFAAPPIKEISVVTAAGVTLCTDFGASFPSREVLSSEPLIGDGRTLIETVRVGGFADPMIRIRRPGDLSTADLAALVPAELMLAQVSSRGAPLNSRATMTTREGVLIGRSGQAPASAEPAAAQAKARLSSPRYGLMAETSMPSGAADVVGGELHSIAGILTAGIAALLLLLPIAMRLIPAPRKRRDNPIAEMERAMEAGEFVPYYQPVVDIRSGRLRGAEVLIRWRKPDGMIVPPATFIPLAESSGLIIELTRQLMRQVRDEVGPAFGLRPTLKVGFNLTAQHFADEQIVADVREIFVHSPMRMTQIVLEVTERQPLENLIETRRVVAALQGLGVRVAIDDVGTGHSGLSYMLKLGVDIIKIDKMFIDAIGIDRHSTTIVETLIDLARNMRMEVIAEGVENFEQVIALRELGIRAAQGFVFAPPLPGSAFLALVEAIEVASPAPTKTTATPIKVPPLRNLVSVAG